MPKLDAYLDRLARAGRARHARANAKAIREALPQQHCYLNTHARRLRVFNVRASREGSLMVRVQQHTPAALGHGRMVWREVGPKESVTIYACTPMEETLTGVI